MRFLIYGAKGWIGSQFIKILEKDEKDYIIGESRLYNINDVEKEIDKYNPTHIFSFIGRTHGKIGNKIFSTIDYLEQNGKLVENIRDNLFSPLNIALLCKKKNIHLTYLGTGCIFKYDEEHPFGKEENGFKEECKPNFFGSSYSIVKGFTDQIMKMFSKFYLKLY